MGDEETQAPEKTATEEMGAIWKPKDEAPKDTRNIYQRFHAAMREVSYVQKFKPSGMQYSIVSHDDVTAAVRPALMNHGIHYSSSVVEHGQVGTRTEMLVAVMFRNIDDPDDCLEVMSLGYGLDSQDKGPGKAMSYAVKYALLKTLGLETGDDPDLDQKTEHVTDEEIRETEASHKAATDRIWGECVKLVKPSMCKGGTQDAYIKAWLRENYTDMSPKTLTVEAMQHCKQYLDGLAKERAQALAPSERMEEDAEHQGLINEGIAEG